MNHSQTVDLHDVDAYWKSRNLEDDKHRPYCLRHYAYRTEQAYLEWLGRYGRFAPR